MPAQSSLNPLAATDSLPPAQWYDAWIICRNMVQMNEISKAAPANLFESFAEANETPQFAINLYRPPSRTQQRSWAAWTGQPTTQKRSTGGATKGRRHQATHKVPTVCVDVTIPTTSDARRVTPGNEGTTPHTPNKAAHERSWPQIVQAQTGLRPTLQTVICNNRNDAVAAHTFPN